MMDFPQLSTLHLLLARDAPPAAVVLRGFFACLVSL